MKQLFITLTLSLLFLASCTQKEKQKTENLDFAGVYKGSVPCADCTRIETALTLNKDKTFVYSTVYKDKVDGAFTHKGTYEIKDSIVTIQLDNAPFHFLVGDNKMTLLGKSLTPNSGKLAPYYELKKQTKFAYAGKYATLSKSAEEYKQMLEITADQKNTYLVNFSASKVKDRANCNFSGVGTLKNDTLWVNIANEKDKEILMYIVPSHDNLGVDVFTKNFEERFQMMFYCKGGSSLAGRYLKKGITANNIGVVNNKMTIADVLQNIPLLQIQKKKGKGEFAEDIYDDYEIYSDNGQLLFTVTPKDTANIKQKINRVLVQHPFFKTAKGIDSNSTYGAIKKAYTITKIQPTRKHIIVSVAEINADFSISKTKLRKGWWNAKTQKVNPLKIPDTAQIDSFILWWNK